MNKPGAAWYAADPGEQGSTNPIKEWLSVQSRSALTNADTPRIAARLPHDHEAEAQTLGATLLKPDREVLTTLRAESFFDDYHAKLWRLLQDESAKGTPIDDASLLAPKLVECGIAADLTDAAYQLAELLKKQPTAANLHHYAERVQNAAVRRMIAVEADRIQKAACSSQSTTSLINQLKGVADRLDDQATNITYPILTGAELDRATIDVSYTIPGVLASRQPCIFAGGHKTMKTSLGIDLALSIATGTKFLNEFVVSEAERVLFMSGESGLGTLQETARRICDAKGIKLASAGGFLITDKIPYFADPEHLSALRRAFRSHEATVLIVDPAYLAMSTNGNESSMFAMGALLGGFAEVCAESGVTPILMHHTRKTGIEKRNEPAQLEHVAWSGFAEFARQWILLARREEYEPGTGLHRLWLTSGGSAGHSGCWGVDVFEGEYKAGVQRQWELDVLLATDVRAATRDDEQDRRRKDKDAKVADDANQILAVMRSAYPDGETRTTIRDASGVSGTSFNRALPVLLNEGRIVSCTIFKGNRTKGYDAFKPVELSQPIPAGANGHGDTDDIFEEWN